MIGIVLAGGLAKRLRPSTLQINKAIFPVGRYPMIYYPINTLIASGIKDIVIVTNPFYGRLVETVVQNLKFKKAKIRFVSQPKPLGMPDAIYQTRLLVKKEPIMVLAADNIFGGKYKKFMKFSGGEISFLRKVASPQNFGCPVYDRRGKLIDIIEKPKNPQTNWAICGPHIFDPEVFNIIPSLKLSSRKELEIADIHKIYLRKGLLKLIKTRDYWSDTGTFESLAETSFNIINRKVRFPFNI